MSSEAGDLCENDEGPWECLFTCAANDKVTGCNSYRMCLEDLCGLSLYSSGSSSGDDDDDDAGFCGG
jgi:hypothetical protein